MALPAPQKGDSPLIPIELNQLIPVITHTDTGRVGSAGLEVKKHNGETFSVDETFALGVTGGNAGGTGKVYISNDIAGSYSGTVFPSNLWADARNMRINSSTISELRTAFQIQKLFEKDARGGTRYQSMLKAHFGVDAQDYRLQRPEFLGRYKSLVGMQSVPQTSSTNETSPQGNLAAYSVTTGMSNLFNKSFVEHGFVHVFVVARQTKTYQQGIEKFWSRRERFDFYYPTLAHISEQPIYNREIYALGDDGDEVFGYQEAWADYRYKPNRVCGQFRTGVANSLDIWHYADYYDSTPRLSSEWIIDNSDINVNRTLAVKMEKDDQIRMDVAFNCITIRPMPVMSIPGLVDHF